MKSLLPAFLALLIVSLPAVSSEPTSGSNPLVKSTVALFPAKAQAGATTELRILLKPDPGIHIVIQPPVDVKIDSSAAIAAIGKVNVPVAADKEHLDTSKPVRLVITLAKSIKPGTVNLKGTLVYYYCSDTEGTCNRFKQPIDVRLKVVR